MKTTLLAAPAEAERGGGGGAEREREGGTCGMLPLVRQIKWG